MPRFQERFRRIAFARESESSEALIPFPMWHMWHIRIGGQPAVQFVEIGDRNPAFPKTQRQVVHDWTGRRLPNFRHSGTVCGIRSFATRPWAADFAFVFGVLQALQADMKGLFGSTEAGVGRRRSAGVTRAAISALGPPCRNRFSGVLAAFFGCEPGRTGWAALLAALTRQANRSGTPLFCSHTSIVREGSQKHGSEVRP